MSKGAEGKLWWTLQSVLNAMDELARAKREKRQRINRARDWMIEDPHHRTVKDAEGYVGLEAASDDVRRARKILSERLEELLQKSPELLAALGKPE